MPQSLPRRRTQSAAEDDGTDGDDEDDESENGGTLFEEVGFLLPMKPFRHGFKDLVKERVTRGAAAYLAAAIQYLLYDWLDSANYITLQYKKHRITPRTLMLAMAADEEWYKFNGHVVMPSAGRPVSIEPAVATRVSRLRMSRERRKALEKLDLRRMKARTSAKARERSMSLINEEEYPPTTDMDDDRSFPPNSKMTEPKPWPLPKGCYSRLRNPSLVSRGQDSPLPDADLDGSDSDSDSDSPGATGARKRRPDTDSDGSGDVSPDGILPFRGRQFQSSDSSDSSDNDPSMPAKPAHKRGTSRRRRPHMTGPKAKGQNLKGTAHGRSKETNARTQNAVSSGDGRSNAEERQREHRHRASEATSEAISDGEGNEDLPAMSEVVDMMRHSTVEPMPETDKASSDEEDSEEDDLPVPHTSTPTMEAAKQGHASTSGGNELAQSTNLTASALRSHDERQSALRLRTQGSHLDLRASMSNPLRTEGSARTAPSKARVVATRSVTPNVICSPTPLRRRGIQPVPRRTFTLEVERNRPRQASNAGPSSRQPSLHQNDPPPPRAGSQSPVLKIPRSNSLGSKKKLVIPETQSNDEKGETGPHNNDEGGQESTSSDSDVRPIPYQPSPELDEPGPTRRAPPVPAQQSAERASALPRSSRLSQQERHNRRNGSERSPMPAKTSESGSRTSTKHSSANSAADFTESQPIPEGSTQSSERSNGASQTRRESLGRPTPSLFMPTRRVAPGTAQLSARGFRPLLPTAARESAAPPNVGARQSRQQRDVIEISSGDDAGNDSDVIFVKEEPASSRSPTASNVASPQV